MCGRKRERRQEAEICRSVVVIPLSPKTHVPIDFSAVEFRTLKQKITHQSNSQKIPRQKGDFGDEGDRTPGGQMMTGHPNINDSRSQTFMKHTKRKR